MQSLIWNPPVLRRMIPRLRRYRLVHSLRARLLALNSTEVSRDPVDPALRSRLQVEMAPEVAGLGHLLGRDLSSWVDIPTVEPTSQEPALRTTR